MDLEAVILSGGFGTRLGDETLNKPKPMIEVAGKPLLIHIMNHLSKYGISKFVIALGYKGEIIKDYFENFGKYNLNSKVIVNKNSVEYLDNKLPAWEVSLIDTGIDTLTGGRIKKIIPFLKNENFLMTYGDGVGNVEINELLSLHLKAKRLSTVTAVNPKSKFGILSLDGDRVSEFKEKQFLNNSWINGGFFILNKKVDDFIPSESVAWESEPMENLVQANQLSAYRHSGFWHAVDTQRDRLQLEQMIKEGKLNWLD